MKICISGLALAVFLSSSVFASPWLAQAEFFMEQLLSRVPEGAGSSRAAERPSEAFVIWGNASDAYVMNLVIRQLGRNAFAVSVLEALRDVNITRPNARTLPVVRGLSEVYALLSRQPLIVNADEVTWIAGNPHFRSVSGFQSMEIPIRNWLGDGEQFNQTFVFSGLVGGHDPRRSIEDSERELLQLQLSKIQEIRSMLGRHLLFPGPVRVFAAPIREYVDRFGDAEGIPWDEARAERLFRISTEGLNLSRTLKRLVIERIAGAAGLCRRAFEPVILD